ncbi:MAG: hypothetical protein KGQ60_00495 [Planctomycetes bacterium]|nr:hypothetical protein [Planctomycetota bacterium]
MLLNKARLGLLAIVFLVALRFVIGFHFYMEGASKVREGNFTSVGFLTAAKGPLADKFHQLIPDYEGLFRLPDLRELLPSSEQKPTPDDPDKVLSYKKFYAFLDGYAESASALYAFNEDQKESAKSLVAKAKSRLKSVVDDWSPQIIEYLKGYDRIAKNSQDETKAEVEGLRKQRDEIEAKWRALTKPALSEIDKITNELESEINALATSAQVGTGKEKKYAKLKLPGTGPIDVKIVDKYLPIFDMVVGILLMLGLLTPLAALAAGIFLASVVLTQFPGYPGTQPTYYQAIEMLGCFFLAFSDAGRYAGLDFLPWSFWNRRSSKVDETARR